MINRAAFFLILLVLMVAESSNGQSQPAIDSLLKEVTNTSKAVDSKISTLNSLSKAYRKIDADSAMIFARKSLNLSQTKGLEKRKPESLLRLGDVFRSLNSFDSALFLYSEGISLAKKNNDFEFGIKLHNNLGLLYKNANLYSKAISCYKKSSTLRKKVDDRKGLASSFNNMANAYKYLGHYDSAVFFYKQSIKIRLELQDSRRIGLSYQNISNLFTNITQYDSAIHYSKLAVKVYQEDKDEQSVAEVMNNMGLTLMYKSDYKEALRYYLQSIQKYDSLDLGKQAAYTYQNMALLFEQQGLYKNAELYVGQSIPLYEQANDQKGLAHAYHYLAGLSASQNRLGEAIAYDIASLNIFDSLGFTKNTANTHQSLGRTYNQKGDYPKAKEHLEKSLELKKESGDERSLANLYNSIGANHFYLKQYGQAIANYEKSVQMANNIGALEIEKRALFGLAEAHNAKGEFSKVYDYFSRYNTLKDTLFNKEQSEAIAEMQTKYETEKKEKEIVRLQYEGEIQEAQTQKKEAERNAMIVASLLLLLLSGAVYWAYRLKQKANHKLEVKNGVIREQVKERELLHRELHHRVKNNLQLISSIMGLQSFNAKDAKVSRAIQEGKSRVEAMTLIHRNLYRTDNVTHVNIKEYIDKLAANIKSSFGEDFSEIITKVDNVAVKVDDVIPIGLIVNEVLCNTFKHGKNENDKLAAEIEFKVHTDHCMLNISDNGGGLPHQQDNEKPGFGMGLIGSLSRQLKGELSMKPNIKGITVVLKLKNDIIAKGDPEPKMAGFLSENGKSKNMTHV